MEQLKPTVVVIELGFQSEMSEFVEVVFVVFEAADEVGFVVAVVVAVL